MVRWLCFGLALIAASTVRAADVPVSKFPSQSQGCYVLAFPHLLNSCTGQVWQYMTLDRRGPDGKSLLTVDGIFAGQTIGQGEWVSINAASYPSLPMPR